MALGAALVAAGCKPGGPRAGSAGDISAEEYLGHLKLAGLVEDGSKQWALFLLAVPGRAAEHLKLMPGQRLGDLELLAIDREAESVGVRVRGLEAELSLAANGLRPQDSYSWLQRLCPDEHARRHNSPARQEFVGDHSQAQEAHQREELAREMEERQQLLEQSSGEHSQEQSVAESP
jgi:hypothetical protein